MHDGLTFDSRVTTSYVEISGMIKYRRTHYARSTNEQKTEKVQRAAVILPNELEIYEKRGPIKVGRRFPHL